jgi:hypothetical protein
LLGPGIFFDMCSFQGKYLKVKTWNGKMEGYRIPCPALSSVSERARGSVESTVDSYLFLGSVKRRPLYSTPYSRISGKKEESDSFSRERRVFTLTNVRNMLLRKA